MHPERSLKQVLGLDDASIELEERRLFYVGVTRAKESLYILTKLGNESKFIADLRVLPGTSMELGGISSIG